MRDILRTFTRLVTLGLVTVALNVMPTATSAASAPPASGISMAKTKPAPKAGCALHASAKYVISLTSPSQGAKIALSRSPKFVVKGAVGGSRAAAISRVDVIAGDSLVGRATLAKPTKVSAAGKRRPWSFTTSAPAGRSTLLICALVGNKAVAKATLRIDVVAPPKKATVLAPAVKKLAPSQVKKITSVTSSSVTFSGPVSLSAGQVIVEAPTGETPSGFARVVTGVSTVGGTTVVSTTPAALDQVFYQLDVNEQDVPLVPVTGDQVPVASRSRLGMMDGDARRTSAVDLPTLSVEEALEVSASTCHDGDGCTLSGDLSLEGSVDAELDVSLTTQIHITTHWDWGVPVPTVDEFEFLVTGTLTQNYSVTATGTGTLNMTKAVIPDKALDIIPLWDFPPVWIDPAAGLNLDVSASIAADTKFGGSYQTTLQIGGEYLDGHFQDLSFFKNVPVGNTTPWDAGGSQVTGSLSVALSPEVVTKLEDLAGPDVSLEAGLEGSETYPCPGQGELDAFADGKVGFKVSVLDHDLVDSSFTVAKVKVDLAKGEALGCGPSTTTTTSPAGGAGTTTTTSVPTPGVWPSASISDAQLDAITCDPGGDLCITDDYNGDVIVSTDPTGGADAWDIDNVDDNQINAAMSCPSSTLCLVGDSEGNILVSTSPSDPSSVWPSSTVAGNGITGIACPSVDLCLATDYVGNVYWTTTPTLGNWQSEDIDPGVEVHGLACPSANFCVAVDVQGDIAVSTDPAGGAWDVQDVDGDNYITSVSCPTVSFCAVQDEDGNVLTSSDPTSNSWVTEDVDPNAQEGGGSAISCPTTNFCAAGDDSGYLLTSSDPAGGAAAWASEQETTNEMFATYCISTSVCLAGDNQGNLYWTTTASG